jgi:hypothetical protein
MPLGLTGLKIGIVMLDIKVLLFVVKKLNVLTVVKKNLWVLY